MQISQHGNGFLKNAAHPIEGIMLISRKDRKTRANFRQEPITRHPEIKYIDAIGIVKFNFLL